MQPNAEYQLRRKRREKIPVKNSLNPTLSLTTFNLPPLTNDSIGLQVIYLQPKLHSKTKIKILYDRLPVLKANCSQQNFGRFPLALLLNHQ